MFDTNDYDQLDRDYFIVICIDAYDVTLRSRNTGHYWYLHLTESQVGSKVIVYHKHEWKKPYHFQKRVTTIRQAVRLIKDHDKWQIMQNKRNHVRVSIEPVWSMH